jgi:hypothetical protein
MNEAVFPLHVSQALDRLSVPKLPAGFSDRILARIAADDLPYEAGVEDIALPVLRRPVGTNGWRRSGQIIFAVTAFGLATATAAAAGVFGDPVYIPVVSQALAKAQIVEMPTEKPVVKKVTAVHKTPDDTIALSVKPEASGKDKVIALIAEIRADPVYRNLPRNERREHAKAEIAKLLADGTVQNADVKAAWAQLATERNAADNARIEQGLPVPKRRIIEAKQRAKPLTPEQKEKVREAVKQLTEAQRAELQALRQRRREATPQERRAVQGEIRAFWRRVGIKPTTEDTTNETP